MNPALAKELFATGYDTLRMANMIGCTEAEAYNALAQRQRINQKPQAVAS